MQLNPHYAELNESYLFSTIAHKVADYQKAHPDADIIRLGIGAAAGRIGDGGNAPRGRGAGP